MVYQAIKGVTSSEFNIDEEPLYVGKRESCHECTQPSVVLKFDCLIEELKAFPLYVAYMKQWKSLKKETPHI